jgi:hypothetical protein
VPRSPSFSMICPRDLRSLDGRLPHRRGS